jgi:hypothetical protein
MRNALILFLISITNLVYSGNITDSMKVPFRFPGNITVTNNGVSPIPAFSLGEPALMIRVHGLIENLLNIIEST